MATVPVNGSGTVANGEIPVVGAEQIDGHAEQPNFTNDGSIIETDVIVIGAGLTGMTAIDRVRKAGLRVKCFESGSGYGGVWYWNRYPGARVDSEAPFYQLNIPEVYKTWNFTERFPSHTELREYMAHVDKTLDLRKDTYFKARVVDARYDETTNKWTIKTLQGHVATGKYLILAAGLLHRTYKPDFPGLKDFKGEVYHSAEWNESFQANGKKIGLIGGGATAVQITQELGKVADELTVFIRRPSYCLAMQQRPLTSSEQQQMKVFWPAMFKAGRGSYSGFPAALIEKSVLDVTKEEREEVFEFGWKAGGFHYALSGFSDTAIRPESNQIVYDWWRKQVCSRLTDPAKNEIMAPKKMPYYFMTKRTPLEQDYYEVLNQPSVHIHDLAASPLKTFTEDGIVMENGETYTFDAVVLATGFDSFTGSLTTLGLRNKHGELLSDVWKDGVSTYLGLTMSGFPNLFMAYSPQAPTALSNGPTVIEAQAETVVDMIKKLEAEGAKSIEPTKAAEEEWKATLDGMIKYTLFPFTDSWWNGGNIPGKKAENYTHIGGVAMYETQCRATMEDWKGFEVVKA